MREFLLIAVALCISIAHADTTIKIRTLTISSNPAPNVQNPARHIDIYYRQGVMRRKEGLGDGTTPIIVDIANCDSRTGYLLDVNARQYRNYKVVRFWPEQEQSQYLKNNPKLAVKVESLTIDTKERKLLFGYTARHLITHIKLATRESRSAPEETIDGWYIDHELPDYQCTPASARTDPSYVLGTELVMYPEIPEFHHSGPLPTGLPVSLTRTMRDSAGQTFTVKQTIEELSNAAVPPSLFQVPIGFKENPKLLK